MDYNKLNFKAGIEIHQQLEGKKLFCSCPTEIIDGNPDNIIKRKLRASAGEKGEVDIAAKYEQKIGKEFYYQIYDKSVCLIDLDEQPPNKLNKDALKTALQVSLLLNSDIFDNIQFMRKVVIDGSNTTGFQRTALIAKNGFIKTSKGKVGIDTICLEEEAAKIVEKDDNKVVYNLSRMGIPLIEIATKPDIKNPEHAKEVAETIGMILRSVKGIKRGLGSIRQDVNVSVKNGPRVELKGFQEIRYIKKVIENEVERHLKLSKKLKSEVRNVKPDGKSEFLRPMPGASRMYPESDLPILNIKSLLKETKKPELITEKAVKLEKKYKLKPEYAKEIVNKNIEFEKFMIGRFDANLIAKILIEMPKELKSRFNLDIEKLKNEDYLEVIKNIKEGVPERFAIKMLEDILRKGKINKNNYKIAEEDKLEKEIKNIVKKNKELIKERGEHAIGALMGDIMKKFKGKVDAKKASELLKEEIKKIL